MLKTRLIVAAVLLLLISSCSKKENIPDSSALFDRVPANASVVVNINTGSLRKKIDWGYINANPMLAFLKLSMKDNILVKYFNDAESTGIDFDGEAICYVIADTTSKGNNVIYTLMKLKDEKKFEDMIKTFTKTEKLIISSPYKSCAGKGMIAGWQDDILIMVQSMNEMNTDGGYMQPLLDNAFNIKTNLAANNPAFKELSSLGSDIDIWTNSASFMRYMGKADGSVSLKADMLYSVNFNKGDITADIATSPEDAAGRDVHTKIFGRAPKTDMLGYLPDYFTMVMHMSVEPQEAIKGLEMLTGENIIEKLRSEMDSSTTDEDIMRVLSQLNGEGVIASGSMAVGEMKKPAFVSAFSVKSDSALQMITGLMKDITIEKRGDITLLRKEDDTIFAMQKNKVVFLASNTELLQQSSDGKNPAQQLNNDIASDMKQKPFVLYVDGESLKSGQEAIPGGFMPSMILNLFEDAEITADPMQGDTHHAKISIRISDKSDYSINVIIKTVLDGAGNMFKQN